jgi:hypothetical protein
VECADAFFPFDAMEAALPTLPEYFQGGGLRNPLAKNCPPNAKNWDAFFLKPDIIWAIRDHSDYNDNDS